MTNLDGIRPLYKLKSLYVTDNKLKSLGGIEELQNLKNISF